MIAMGDFSIKIVPGEEGAQFQVDIDGFAPGVALEAPANSCITWNNTTDQPHQLTDGGTYQSGEIDPGSSNKNELVLLADVTYHCTLHDGETGQINVVEAIDMNPPPC
jgi:hypothetical protein